jgi:hypothetical protein
MHFVGIYYKSQNAVAIPCAYHEGMEGVEEVNVAALCVNCITSERAHSTHCVGGWASRAGLDTTAVSRTRIPWATGLWFRHLC